MNEDTNTYTDRPEDNIIFRHQGADAAERMMSFLEGHDVPEPDHRWDVFYHMYRRAHANFPRSVFRDRFEELRAAYLQRGVEIPESAFETFLSQYRRGWVGRLAEYYIEALRVHVRYSVTNDEFYWESSMTDARAAGFPTSQDAAANAYLYAAALQVREARDKRRREGKQLTG